jgi:hypothetical protein
MGKGLPRSHARRDPQVGVQDLAISINSSFTIDGATGVGFGSVVVGGLPEGNILLLGAVAQLQFAGSGADPGLVDTWVGDFGVGSTPAADATISGTDVDLIASTALAAATAEVSPLTRAENATQAFIDNKAGTGEININLLVDDVSISADGVPITVTGQLHLAYIMLGDV